MNTPMNAETAHYAVSNLDQTGPSFTGALLGFLCTTAAVTILVTLIGNL